MAYCSKCNAPIEWVKTEKGKNMPVDAETYHGEPMYDYTKHQSHFASCPNAEEYRGHSQERTNQENENRKQIAIVVAKLNQLERKITNLEEFLVNQAIGFLPRD